MTRGCPSARPWRAFASWQIPSGPSQGPEVPRRRTRPWRAGRPSSSVLSNGRRGRKATSVTLALNLIALGRVRGIRQAGLRLGNRGGVGELPDFGVATQEITELVVH